MSKKHPTKHETWDFVVNVEPVEVIYAPDVVGELQKLRDICAHMGKMYDELAARVSRLEPKTPTAKIIGGVRQ